MAAEYIKSGAADVTVVVCDAACLERNLILALQIMNASDSVILCLNIIDEAKKKGVDIDVFRLSELLCVPVVACSAGYGRGLEALMNEAARRASGGGFVPPLKVPVSPGASFEEEAAAYVNAAERIARECVKRGADTSRDRRADRMLASRVPGYPIMALFLILILWITITGANVPSELLSSLFSALGEHLHALSRAAALPEMLSGALIDGVYRVLTWVVAVMLPPMAIFFPLFALLEDLGYLPRIAFCLDSVFRRACACGKQSLTMCMGFGCNAVGVSGCRIIDSERERLIAMITNSFVPCNGRFPSLIAIITMFFAGSAVTGGTLVPALILAGVILLGVLLTLLVSRLLSVTCLRGVPSSFILELPPYRMPRVGRVIMESLKDRIIFVLGRAASVAAPAGLVIWLLANVCVGDKSLFLHCAAFLDPFARLCGLDGVILIAFILGFPANEIVFPLIVMGYMASGSVCAIESLSGVRELLLANGWSVSTAICTLLFTLVHWPCSTTLLTIKKESGSPGWTALSMLVPAACGFVLCFAAANIMRLFGL